MEPLIGNQAIIVMQGTEVLTLRDILPSASDFRVLIVGKTPIAESVNLGHYFQGKHGVMFWNRLREYGLLTATSGYEDDSLPGVGYGITDIAKTPREYGEEPSKEEYVDGAQRILSIIRERRPAVVVFVYKKVLDKMLRWAFGVRGKTRYGFNDSLQNFIGARVFVFPLPGTPCNRHDAKVAMLSLVSAVGLVPR